MSTFRRLVRMECRKAFRNKFFYTALAAGMLFAFMSGMYQISLYYDVLEELEFIGGDPMVGAFSLYNRWLGADNISLGSTFFFYLLPLLAAVPYGWSYAVEQKSGYVCNVAVRGGKWKYFLAKYIAMFLSGGLTVLIPLACSLAAVACFVPATRPSYFYVNYLAVPHGNLWSGLFYRAPLVFTLLHILLAFVFAGLFADLCFSISLYIKNQFAVVLLPFFAVYGLDYSYTLWGRMTNWEISPLRFLSAGIPQNSGNTVVVLAEMALLLALSFGLVMRAGVKREIL